MALKDTAKKMKDLLDSIQHDLAKAEKGNKAAAQRVRTDSIKLEKVAKLYRKESIKAEKSGLLKRKPSTK
ncbi:Histone-Like Developmental Protein, partial [Chlamydia pneumoniae B21]